ncbi:hypothetical protein DCAR_0208460 [Daucus carota subsp. sativus]|uniref:Uncharacterized protein n=1 Tax=Daucus carota subsp. sativus TaxID=79200 RepID=A0A161XI03_DAUCS|nr:PREDICTED: thylakoid lumenal 17.9 kDa protein, chloroplastic [Daucus carota subsp. sativus]WOG89223.1 hypothetical protein DCAR_0208460 [Daucus carota subsp. sativus]
MSLSSSTQLLSPFLKTSKLNSSSSVITSTSTSTRHPVVNFLPSLLSPNPKTQLVWTSNIISIALAITTFTSPLPSLAIPSFNSPPPSTPPTTPFSQAKNLPTGLDNGTIRACPSTNPSCISTNPKSSSSAFPWLISQKTSEDNPAQQLFEAILETQKNVKIDNVEHTPTGDYLQAEVDGNLGRDVLEFLVKGDVVAYRAMATKVTYLYPFTTALGDSKGQEERLKKIVDQLGWYAPTLESME